MSHTALLTPAREERLQYGKSLRRKVSRACHSEWDPKRRDVSALELLRASERRRIATLLPIKAARMAASPFGFYRGSVPVMAFDLSKLPSTGIYAQLCGDAHVHNLGAFAGQDGRLIFDINDFDETIRGPWEWDVKRMAASLVLAGRESSNTEKDCKVSALAFVESYQTAMLQCAGMPVLNVLRTAERATPGTDLYITENDGSNPFGPIFRSGSWARRSITLKPTDLSATQSVSSRDGTQLFTVGTKRPLLNGCYCARCKPVIPIDELRVFLPHRW